MGTPENLSITETKLKRIAWLSKQDPEKEFECLMHLFNKESLLECFNGLGKDKAVGIDGVDKAKYAENLEENLDNLLTKMKNMAYRPSPVREVLIRKEGKKGATRPLGISTLEDKIVQKMMQRVLESIYEPLFLECSYGFRPGRGCHKAVEALHKHLFFNNVQRVIDIDLKNYFGSIDHHLLERALRKKIKDPKLMRYIIRMFKAGVMGKHDLTVSDEGVPQGSICSPILSNVFAHYVLDIWIQNDIKSKCKGQVKLFRYADDAVMCCQFEEDATKLKVMLAKRLGLAKLELNEEKTKLVRFDKSKAKRGFHQESFDFLGFNFYFGKSLKGSIIPKLRTKSKAMKAKLKAVNTWFKENRNKMPLKEIWKIFCSKLRGHIQYYGVSHNVRRVEKFLAKATRIAFKWLNRRSQRKSFNWEKFGKFRELNPLPEARIVHRLF